MSSEEIEYFRARAIEEREAAADAPRSDVAAIHRELARLYSAQARQPVMTPMRRVA